MNVCSACGWTDSDLCIVEDDSELRLLCSDCETVVSAA